jgi:hypothetical protein
MSVAHGFSGSIGVEDESRRMEKWLKRRSGLAF